MGTVYLFALVVAVGVVLVQLFLSADSADGDAVDAHHPGDSLLAPDVLAPNPAAANGGGARSWLVFRLRFWTFALLGFGMLGAFLHFLSPWPRWLTACAAVAMGALAGWIAVFTFSKLNQKDNNSGAEASELVGQLGRVLLPVNEQGLTKVRVRIKGQLVDYVALSGEELVAGTSVLVEEVNDDRLQVSAAPAGLRFNEEE
jgi:membrane protein implicated in regulation of membrane protease activity